MIGIGNWIGMNKYNVFVFFVLLFFSVFALFSVSFAIETIETLSPEQLRKYQFCRTDRDCIVVNNGCCDCANGSPPVAINRERKEDLQKNFDCKAMLCENKSPGPECSPGYVSCIKDRCRFITPLEYQIFGGNLSRE